MYSETDCLVRMGRDDSRLLLCRNLFLARFSSISHSCASFISHACLFYLLLVSLRSLTHHASSISHSSLSFISHVCLFYLSLVCLFHFSLVSLRSLTCVSLSFLTRVSSISHSCLSFISHVCLFDLSHIMPLLSLTRLSLSFLTFFSTSLLGAEDLQRGLRSQPLQCHRSLGDSPYVIDWEGVCAFRPVHIGVLKPVGC